MNELHENVMSEEVKLIDAIRLVALMRKQWFKKEFAKKKTDEEKLRFIIDFIEQEKAAYSIKNTVKKILDDIEFDNDRHKLSRLRDIEIMEEGLFNVREV